jgi:hypothetical protein
MPIQSTAAPRHIPSHILGRKENGYLTKRQLRVVCQDIFSVGHLLRSTRSNKPAAKKSMPEGKNATGRKPFKGTNL